MQLAVGICAPHFLVYRHRVSYKYVLEGNLQLILRAVMGAAIAAGSTPLLLSYLAWIATCRLVAPATTGAPIFFLVQVAWSFLKIPD